MLHRFGSLSAMWLASWLACSCAHPVVPAASPATCPPRTPEPAPAAPAAAQTASVPGATIPAPMVDVLLNGERFTAAQAELPARVTLAPDENFKVVELGRDANSSHHIVALRDREPLHRHDTHDLLVVTLEGHGQMRIGSEERALGPHSIVYVPRGTVHAMRNTAGTILYGYAVFTPPFDGKDRVPVEP